MTKKHFRALVKALNNIRDIRLATHNFHDGAWQVLVNEMVRFCADQNPKFVEEYFRTQLQTQIEES